MALAKCTECGSEISDQAWTCWKCGAPVLPEAWPVVTARHEGKGAKAHLAIAAILMLLGIGSAVAGEPFWGAGLFGLGLVWWLATRIHARRRHG
jgi:hypothetical protein